jgi:hypothetical protein
MDAGVTIPPFGVCVQDYRTAYIRYDLTDFPVEELLQERPVYSVGLCPKESGRYSQSACQETSPYLVVPQAAKPQWPSPLQEDVLLRQRTNGVRKQCED